MSLIEKLKWFWNPQTEAEKAYETDPLRRRNQLLKVYIKGVDNPFIRVYSQEDVRGRDWVFRNANENSFNSDLNSWLDKRGSDGIRIGNVWHAPESIDRIELGQQTVEEL
jgi:hypothetical protein